ncbi:MAG: signal peptidase I [Bacteroidales bacterium]|nr:signal peptidase I [Bacteroidales bacterium]
MNKHDFSALKEIGFTLLSEGKTIKLRADGFSMYPSIKPRSVVFIEPADDISALQKGDIIAWKLEKGFVVHRIVRKSEKDNQLFFVTRGDCNLHEDIPLPGNLIAGKVIRIEYPEGNSVPLKPYRRTKPNYLFNRLSATIMRFKRSV